MAAMIISVQTGTEVEAWAINPPGVETLFAGMTDKEKVDRVIQFLKTSAVRRLVSDKILEPKLAEIRPKIDEFISEHLERVS